MADTELHSQLRQLLGPSFQRRRALRTLCFSLGVEYNDMPGSAKQTRQNWWPPWIATNGWPIS